MIYRVHEAGEELRITFSAEAGAALGLFDGAGVELKAVDLDAMPEGMRNATWEEVEPIQRRMHEEYIETLFENWRKAREHRRSKITHEPAYSKRRR